MKRWIIIAVIALMAGWAIYDFVIKQDAESAEFGPDSKVESTESDEANVEIGLEKGKQAPDFELNTLDGETVKLSDFRGERVLLNFWATWCPPCRAEMPDMQKFYEDKDVVILAVDALETERTIDNVHEFAEEFGVTFDILLDENSKALTIYDVISFPTTYMIDSNGIIQNMAPGALNYEQMVQEFELMD